MFYSCSPPHPALLPLLLFLLPDDRTQVHSSVVLNRMTLQVCATRQWVHKDIKYSDDFPLLCSDAANSSLSSPKHTYSQASSSDRVKLHKLVVTNS